MALFVVRGRLGGAAPAADCPIPPPRGYFSDESRHRRGCDVDILWRRGRGHAAAATSRPADASQVPVLLGLLACSVAAFVEATKDAEDLLKCGVVFCYKLSDKELAKKSKPPYFY